MKTKGIAVSSDDTLRNATRRALGRPNPRASMRVLAAVLGKTLIEPALSQPFPAVFDASLRRGLWT